MKTSKIRNSKEIGAIIKRRRRELGISQEKLAEIMGISYQQVQRYENGTNRLNVENIQVVANAMKVPTAYFFETVRVAEELTSEERRLLQHFRSIKTASSKNTVMQVARLAVKK